MFIGMAVRKTGLAQKRLVILSMAVSVGALIQVWVVGSLLHQDLGIAPTTYPWHLWITLPTRQILSVFPLLSDRIDGWVGVAIGLLVLVLAIVACLTGPYRDQKRAMLFLSACIAQGGMMKFRVALDTQATATRYFYLGSIFVLWALCCLSRSPVLRRGLTLLVVATEVALLPVVAATPRTDNDFAWPVWTHAIDLGLPLIIPTAPEGFYGVLPAVPGGPLADYARWKGRSLDLIGPRIDATLCSGSLDGLEELPKVHFEPHRETPSAKLWGASGTVSAPDPARSFPVLALVGDDDRVVGFGFTGFHLGGMSPTGPASGWRSIFASGGQRTLRAYALTPDGTACPLANALSFPAEPEPVGPETLVEAAELTQGRQVSQRFVPKQRLRRLAVTLVTWGRSPSRYPIDWQVRAHRGQDTLDLGSGHIDAASVRDWQSVDLPIEPPPGPPPDDVEVSFGVSQERPARLPVGLPLVRSANDHSEPAEVDGQAAGSGGHVKLTVTSDQ